MITLKIIAPLFIGFCISYEGITADLRDAQDGKEKSQNVFDSLNENEKSNSLKCAFNTIDLQLSYIHEELKNVIDESEKTMSNLKTKNSDISDYNSIWDLSCIRHEMNEDFLALKLQINEFKEASSNIYQSAKDLKEVINTNADQLKKINTLNLIVECLEKLDLDPEDKEKLLKFKKILFNN